MLFNTKFLSQRAGRDSEPGGVRWGWEGWGGWSVGKKNLDSDVFRKAFVCTQKEVLKIQRLHLNYIKCVDGRLEVRKVPPGGESQSACGTDGPGT